MMEICYKPIGIVHSPFKTPKGAPIQPEAARGIRGYVEVFEEFKDGLKDIGGFSHVILIYHFHMVKDYKLHVVPYMDNREHGVFATRAPARPNPIGISVVKLVSVSGNVLHVENIDILDGTPLLDIKPYVPEFDRRENVQIGWLERCVDRLSDTRDDGRFH